jgi:cellulose biosynthesis protein BcsQ
MRVDLRRSIATRAREALIVVELSGLSVASTVLADRAEWVESAEFGESVADYAPRSTAAAEFKAFVRELERLATTKGVQ